MSIYVKLMGLWILVHLERGQSQTCICITPGSCQLANGGVAPDGSGALDPRIVNNNPVNLPTNVENLTVVSPGLPINVTSQATCPGNLERCCPPSGFNCGIRYPPVAGSRPPSSGQAAYGAYPWQAVLLAASDVYIGSGVLIDNTHVLTAAHKLTSATAVKIRLGEYDASSINETFPALEYGIAKIVIHPGFIASSLRNGIAIIRLNGSVPLGAVPTITNACLTTVQPTTGRCFVSGWGRNDFSAGAFQAIQKEVDLPIVRSDVCQNSLRTTRLGANFSLDTASFMCAGGEASKDSCTGDGGAPLVCFSLGRWYAVGLVSWGIGCGTAGIPGAYINLAAFIPWIQNTTRTP